MEKQQTQKQFIQQSSDQQQQGAECIIDPREFLQFARKDKKIKIMDERNPIWSHVYLKDISLHKKGPLQDKIYAKVDSYYVNIRRGNTLCEIYEGNTQKSQLFFCRRGMKKFYDLEPQYLKVGANLPYLHQLWKRRIFAGLDEELEQGNATIHLYRLFKQNGEHCQIGYSKKLNSWLFGSKNVTILARNIEDLEAYGHKQRFYWAKLIGQQFFKILEKMTEQLRQKLKIDLEGHTLLGEHCGNTQHQHITTYSHVQIIFYGLVNNIGNEHCLPVQQCKRFLQKYGLNMSVCHERKGLTQKNAIMRSLWQMLREVAQASMEKQGQGSVLYMVAKRQGKQKTIGMCKLKTSQYLIYRRLRQMLKLNASRKGATANHIQKYKYDIAEMANRYFRPPRELIFYQKIAEKAFKQISQNTEIDEIYLRYKFAQFINQIQKQDKKTQEQPVIGYQQPLKKIIVVGLPRTSILLQKFFKKNKFDIDYMYRSNKPITKHTLYVLYMIPRLAAQPDPDTFLVIPQYSPAQVKACISEMEQCKDISRSQLISFVKSQNKAKSISMLHEKLQSFRKQCQDTGIPYENVQNPSEQALIKVISSFFNKEVKHQTPLQVPKNGFNKYFVIPLLIPGSGKSTLAKELASDKQNKWKIVDSDKIRRKLMEQKGKVDVDNPNIQELYAQCRVEALNQFQKQIISLALQQNLIQDSFIFLDRLSSPSNIQALIKTLTSVQRQDIKIVILTQSYQPTKLNETTYPYSLNYLLNCLKRCLERQQHQTLSTDPYQIAKVVVNFYHGMQGYNQKYLKKMLGEKIKFVSLQIVEESKQTHFVNQHLKRKIEQCLRLFENGKEPKESNGFIELVEMFYKFGEKNQEKEEGLTRYTKLKEQLQSRLLSQ